MLNYIWAGFFIIAGCIAFIKLIFFNDITIFKTIVKSTFDMSKTAFELSLGLTGVMTLWLGLMKVGEKGGAIRIIAKILTPFLKRIFPDIPKDHPAMGSIVMNFSANMLGLDNAATPMGLKAMKELQEINPEKDTASNAMIMFLVLNTSALILIPVNIMVYRAQLGAADPSDIFIPILITTFCSTLAGLLSVSYYQGIRLINKEVLTFLGSVTVIIASIIVYFSSQPQSVIETQSSLFANIILFSIILSFIGLGLKNKLPVFETFIDGAKEGFSICVKIIPYLVAMLVGIAVFRASGAMELLVDGASVFITFLGFDTEFIPSLPTAFMRPFSGSGARGLMVDAMTTYGADSLVGRITSIMQGSTDTTFYIIAVYFGSISIKKTRHAIKCGLIADIAGMIAAIVIGYYFFG